MLDHLAIQCRNPIQSATFYDSVLGTLGAKRVMSFGPTIGYGLDGKPDFWIGPQQTGTGSREAHIAFQAKDRAEVDSFFSAAAATGTEILHSPRLWPEYHPGYYAAFVRDPDGNNVEAVCHNAG